VPGLNMALEIGMRSLMAHQKALQTTGHNISNANTEGFSRQIPIFTSTLPEKMGTTGYLGSGVRIQEIRRARDIWLDQQVWRDNQTGGYWKAVEGAFQEMESYFPESEESGINAQLNGFFNSWQDLSAAPEEAAQRISVVQNAIALADSFNTAGRHLSALRSSLDADVGATVDEINRIAGGIGSLNYEIRFAEWQNQNANDFRDKRDLLVDQLSDLVNIQVAEQSDGTITVTLGADILVQSTTVEQMQTVVGPTGFLDVEWASTGNPVPATNGKLAGLLYARDTVLPSYQTEIDQLATGLINATNAQHALGFDLSGNPGGAFFVGTDASTMAVAPAVSADPSLIAAASTPTPGDNGNALAIAMLGDQITMPVGLPDTTFNGFYASTLGRLGAESREATQTVENQDLVLRMLDERRQQVSGVSMDEEMSKMIKYQHAYEAAARVVTAVDELLDLVVNRLGIVGR